MPVERRYITFELEEVYKSLAMSYIQKKSESLPSGKLVSLKTQDEPDSSIVANILRESGETIDLHIDRRFFAESLVFYCQGCGIPLPKKGQKVLSILEDKIIMNITEISHIKKSD